MSANHSSVTECPPVVSKFNNACFAKEPSGSIKISKMQRAGYNLSYRQDEGTPLTLAKDEAIALARFILSHHGE